MSHNLALVLWGLVLFEIKHYLCDFVLQTAYQYRNKGIYGHPGGILHAGLHMMGSLPAVLILTKTAWLATALLASEFVLHYHIDWTKEQINKRCKLVVDKTLYWIVFGADQFLHQMTYVVFLAVLAHAANL